MVHLFTHKPANIRCTSCMRGKLRQVPHRAGSFDRPVEKWGDIITVDHMVQTDEDWTIGCDGSKNLLAVKDLATGLKWAYPMPTKSAENTADALKRFCGSYRIGCVYSDGAPELDEACRMLGYPHDKSHPGVPQNNGIIERCNGDILAMTRTCIIHAGLPNHVWPWACQCVCHNDNCTWDEHRESAWYRAHGKGEFNGLLLPFGCAVWFLPATTRSNRGRPASHARPKWGGRACRGIFAGYVMHTGGAWSGRHYVWPLILWGWT